MWGQGIGISVTDVESALKDMKHCRVKKNGACYRLGFTKNGKSQHLVIKKLKGHG
jgi:hypothetical protein